MLPILLLLRSMLPAIPKSINRILQSGLIIMFAGFISRYKIGLSRV